MNRTAGPQFPKPGALASAGLFLVLAAILSSASHAQVSRADTRPDVLMITVDTLRPDALGWISRVRRTPALDRLANAGFRFPAAVAPVPLTLPSHTSMFTGLSPVRHGVRDNGQVLAAGGPELLAERFAAAGYRTGAFVSGFPLARPFGLDRGFQTYDDRFASGERDRLERPASGTVDAVLRWLPAVDTPSFVWVHFYDPHDPYAESPTRDLRAAYDAEVEAVDRAVDRLLSALDARSGTRRSRLTVFAADHGESLGEHGESTHGFFVYQSTVEVPMTFTWPGRIASGESRARARLVDLAPTVLDLLDLPAWNARDGVSLKPFLDGRSRELPAAHSESRRPWNSYGWAPLRAVIEGTWKLIVAPRPELYDLAADPGETTNRYDTERRVARRLAGLVEAGEPAAAAAVSEDPETLARLRALGYLGSPSRPPQVPADVPDPKDRIEIWNQLGAAERSLEQGDARSALVAFDRALASEPRNPFALARSAAACVLLGREAEARARLERALAVAPEQAEIRIALAERLTVAGDFAAAAGQWMELVRMRPRESSHWVSLGGALGRGGQKTRAVEAFARAVELVPDDPSLLLRLGFAAAGAGEPARAAVELERAATMLPPGNFRHAGALGLLLSDSGSSERARGWLERSVPGEPEYAEARLRLARILVAAGERERAATALREALAAEPGLEARARVDPALRSLF